MLVDQLPDSLDTAPTPCTEYDIATLRAHVIGWLTAFADGLSDPDGRCSDPNAVQVLDRGRDQVANARDRIRLALPQAAHRPLWIGDAQLPGDLALSMMLWEYQVHGWDLAQAAGLPWQPEREGLLASLDFAPAMLTPDFQGEGKAFAPPVRLRDGQPPLHRLLALSGRDPHWAP